MSFSMMEETFELFANSVTQATSGLQMTSKRGGAFIVGIGGTTRAGSTSERIIRAVLKDAEDLGAQTMFFGGTDLVLLPHYAPEILNRSPQQLAFVEAVRKADGVVIGTPGYHGGISGLVKNAIDLLEDLRDDGRSYLGGRPVGLVVTAGGWQACGVTLSALRDVVHSLRGWPTPAGIAVNSSEELKQNSDGTLPPGPLRDIVRTMAAQVLSKIATPDT
jgi:FMN reductase